MTDLEIMQTLIKAKELGITQLEIDAYKQKTTLPVAELKPEDIITPMSVLDDMTDEEIDMWSTPYYDELQKKKELHKQYLEEEKAKNGT